MKTFQRYLTATFLSCAMFCTGEAKAMQISQWKALSDKQKDDFGYVLIDGAVNNLQANGHADQIQTVLDLFLNTNPKIGTGKQEFYNSIAKANKINASLPPGSNLLQVEDAFFATLKDHGIEVPLQDLIAIGKTYDPNSDSNAVAPAH